jgi:protein-S-isoprenylcysteine O-methyltransferase Ste14
VSRQLPTLGPRGEGWVAIQFLLLGLLALAGTTGPAWGGPLRVATTALGLTLMVAGTLLGGRGLLDLGRALTPMPRPLAGTSLVAHGAYRLVRHPIYGGIVIGALGWGLAWAAPLAMAVALALFAFFYLKSQREEAWLAEEVAGYREYAQRTRRLIPFVC